MQQRDRSMGLRGPTGGPILPRSARGSSRSPPRAGPALAKRSPEIRCSSATAAWGLGAQLVGPTSVWRAAYSNLARHASLMSK